MTNASIITVPKTVSTRRCNPRTETNTTFKSKIDWLLESAVVGEKIFIGASISVKTNTRQIDGLPEVLILSYGSRLLMIPLENKEEPYWLRNLLRRRLSYGDDRISISMLEGALSSLLIYGKTGLQVKVIELSKEITLGEGRRTWKYTKSILGDLKNKAIGEVNFLSFDGSEDHSVPAFWERSAQRALASYLVAASTSPSSNSIIDTTLRSKRELDFLSQSAAASFALYLLAPKRSKGDVCAPKLLKDGSLELANNRFNTRIRPNSQQIIHFKPTDENDGRGIIFRASGIVGTKSKLKGKGGSLADLTNLNKWEGEWEVRGKEDKSLAENKALEWMGNSISFDPLTGGSKAEFDKSGLLNALVFDEKAPHPPQTSRFMSRTRAFDSLASARLNDSQREAAEKILSSDSHRLVLIQGPPGTGKSNLIGEVAKQWKEWNLGKEIIYAVCQSNLAVRNITSSLSRLDVDFRLVVSFDYKFEWHDHLYKNIQSKVIVTDEIREGFDLKREFSGVSIILCTLASLSSRWMADLTEIKPPHLLIVDEASQVLLNYYPPIFNKFSSTLDRVCFIGDPQQLQPFGAETVPKAKSVFGVPTLRTKALFLDTSYRLPKRLALFISKEVYGGRLKSGPTNVWKGSLSSCVRFIDIDSGEESRAGSSFKNIKEADAILNIIKRDYQGSGLDYKVITTYNGQRSLIEKELKCDPNLDWQDKVFSVDGYQGNEAEHIIISLVKDGTPSSSIGFLSVMNRTNVLLTRTSFALVIVTSKRFIFGKAKDTLVGQLAKLGGEELWASEQDVLNGRARIPKKMIV